MEKRYNFEEYVQIIKRLRAPDGCPWDRIQTHDSLKKDMMDELAETVGAIDVLNMTGDGTNLCEELGDLLLLIVMQSRIAEEEGLFGIDDVVQAAAEKMIRRHPHVFRKNETDSIPSWEEIKREEKNKIPAEIEAAKEIALKRAEREIAEHMCLKQGKTAFCEKP